MSKKTGIQWCDETVNPVMGCDGCELWPTLSRIESALTCLALRFTTLARDEISPTIGKLVHAFEIPTELLLCREKLIQNLTNCFPEVPPNQWREHIEKLFRCYAGILHSNRSGSPGNWDSPPVKGHAKVFERPETFPGRMAKAAAAKDLKGTSRPEKPWLDGLPRLIFVSDMGDALSDGIDFRYLKDEIIDVVATPKGVRHNWLWLTKRPARMAEFADWLLDAHQIDWPENLIAITSVTNRATRSRIDELRRVPAKTRGLSVEPLVESVELDLRGISWVIVGGSSGDYPPEFDIEWARSLREQCREAGVAFFLKQLGSAASENGFPIPLRHVHGGNWDEWPADLRIREFPASFALEDSTAE